MKLSTKCLLTTLGAAAAAGTAFAVQRGANQRRQQLNSETGMELKEYRMINGIPSAQTRCLDQNAAFAD